MFTNKSVTLFLVIVISVSAIFETIVIALRAMGLAVFLMWVPTIAAIIAGCISQKESNGKISFKKLLHVSKETIVAEAPLPDDNLWRAIAP